MRKLFTLLLINVLILQYASAQYFEAGLFGGTSNYVGDLTTSIPEGPEYKPAYGAFVRYNYNRFAAKLHFYKGDVGGADFYSTEASGRRKRNLSFDSPIYEAGFQLEFNLFPYKIWATRNASTPYLFAGFSGFYFNPSAVLGGVRYELQPLGTEGQNLPGYQAPYSLYSYAIPMGGGIRLSLTRQINVGAELGLRMTFTDYIDDVSGFYPDLQQLTEADPIAARLSYRSPEYDAIYFISDPSGERRGSPAVNDYYLFAGLTISYNFGITSDFAERKRAPKAKGKPQMEF
ncbi:MAG: DUF6089 family protein [Bacteroidota bacterium]